MRKQIKNRKKIVLSVFSLIALSMFILLINPVLAQSFSRSFVGYSPYSGFDDSYVSFDRSLCEKGQDFILYVSPLGCTPSVVRSDLLEEQNNAVFCPITAIQLNPLIDVEAINSISITGQYPKEVSGVGYYPAQAALGRAGFQLNQPVTNEVGYAVIVLKQQKNESSMPDFVEGTLTARISYDIKNAFGLGQATFYLPQMNDDEWDKNFKEYSFWQGRGYLRAESIGYDSAVISVYSGREAYGTSTTDKKIWATTGPLEAGETSREIFMPGFDYCMGGLQLKLNDLENPDTTVRLNINGDYFELQEGEKFLDNKCFIPNEGIEKRGIVQQATIRCRDDTRGNVNLLLSINPKIKISINGIEKEVNTGDKLFETKDGEKSVYIAHITTKEDTKMEEDLIIALVELPEIKEKLSDEEIRSFSDFFNRAPKEDASGFVSLFKEFFKTGISSFETIERWVISGESFRIVSYPGQITDIFGNLKGDISGKEIKIIGFADAMDSDLSWIFEDNETSSEFGENYENAISDYNDVIEGHAGETYPPEIEGETLDQQALYEKIDLMWRAQQRRTVIELCKDYEEKYPDFSPPDVCGDAYKYSSPDIDSESVEINGRVYSIMIDGVKEPTFDDFGAVVSVKTPEGNTLSRQLIKNEVIYLETIYSYDAGPKSSPIYYKYSDEGWQWSPDKTYWMSVDTTRVSGGEFKGREPVQEQKEIINYLNKNKPSLQDGEKYLLETGAKKGTGGAFIQLIDIDKDLSDTGSVKIRTNIRETKEKIFIGEAVTITLKEGFPDSRGGYVFTLQKVNLQKVAKVSVVSNVNRQETEATFPFKIGIEKRAIQLSPEKTEERIESLNKTIEQWRGINDNLGTVVKAGKAACFGTGTFLVAKNFFANLGGKGTARQIVMRGSGGWFEQCEKMVNSGEFPGTVDECLSEHNDEIEDAVNETASEIGRINRIFREEIPQCKGTSGFLGEKFVNTEACLKEYLEKQKPSIENDINQAGLTNVSVEGKDVPVSSILGNITSDNTLITQARDIELYSALLDSKDQRTKEIAKAQLNSIFSDVWINSQAEVERSNFADKYGAAGAAAIISLGRGLQPIPATEITTLGNLNLQTTLAPSTPAYLVHDRDEKIDYLLILDDTNAIRETYRINADRTITKVTTEGNELNPLGLTIKKFDASTYKNKCPTCEVRYYQTGTYEGLPAIVPFDIENGWYAAIKPILPLGGGQSLQPYDASGRVTNFYLCNVGPDGREDFFRVVNFGGADDVCRLVNLGKNQPYDQFPGISSAEAERKVEQAQLAFSAASSYNSKIRKGDFVNIMGQRIKVGDAAVGTPDIQCQDFMSPSECNILFNVCDPFICPSSRCDLGGTYQVDNVIQSGVIGSMVLCLPNFPEVKIPVCISGVYAGIDGYLSILEEYQECLQTSLDTGQQVGVCDTLHSIYTCDFFWRQSLPAVKYALPELVGSLLGKNIRGGGEYLNVQDSFDRASDSVNFFTQYYAADSFKAFQARSIEGVGAEVCRNWLSVPGMDAGKLFDALIAPDSPSQFLGWFDEIPYTTATVPPISHYKVFYHIYAGQDFPANYEVYLRGISERRLVDKGFIEAGERVQRTEDFTAVSGYNELCIMVNNQEECGFKQVSTDFAVQYLSDKFAADEASRTDITTEQACISGNPNILSLVSPNIQAGTEEMINPEIYNRGITRVCSTDNPGLSTDPNAGTENARWQEVGYCDTPNVKCWLDTKSVEDSIDITTIEDKALGEVEENWISVLEKDLNLIDNFGEFASELESMKNKGNYTGIINKINENFDRVFFSYEKGYLTLIRGNAFSTLTKEVFSANLKENQTGTDGTGGTSNKPAGSDEKEPEEVQKSVRSCEKCDHFGLQLGCAQSSCEEISAEREKQGLTGCEFIPEPGLKWNQCIDKTSLECSTITECQKALGNEIIEIAREVKQEKGVSDASVKEDTAVKNFECLVLMVAMTESTIQHCSPAQKDGNPLYCDGEEGAVKGDEGGSIGVMQININAHADAFPDAYYFRENVRWAINHLVSKYNEDEKIYDCYRSRAYGSIVRASDFEKRVYSGWKRALREYNGWNTKCYVESDDKLLLVGNPYYVEDVLGTSKNKVVQLFPEVCGN